MKIAVLSGKGGTGKTLVSVNLAAAAKSAAYMDCDIEEPNGHLFLKPEKIKTAIVYNKIPVVDENRCTGCRICVDFCKFNALAYISGKLRIFEDICHSCGGCQLFCPEDALWEKDKEIGKIETGVSENVQVLTGILNTGEASGIPIINRLLERGSEMEITQNIADAANESHGIGGIGSTKTEKLTVIDCPPGSACSVMESIKDADYCLLVAEPTLFGSHNLRMVHELVTLFKKPHGVVLNKCLEGENPSEIFCKEYSLPILAKIPFDHELGTLNSKALIAVREQEKYRKLFSSLLQKIVEEVAYETVIGS